MSKAVVNIERPARWAKQLGSHLGHEIAVAEIENGWSFTIDGAYGEAIASGDSELTLTAQGNDDELRGRMENVLQKHLLKFAADLNPEIIWH